MWHLWHRAFCLLWFLCMTLSPPSASGDEPLCSPPEFLHISPSSSQLGCLVLSHTSASHMLALVSLAQLPKAFIIFSQNTVEGESRGSFNFLVLIHAVVVGWLSGWPFIDLFRGFWHLLSIKPCVVIPCLPVQLEVWTINWLLWNLIHYYYYWDMVSCNSGLS